MKTEGNLSSVNKISPPIVQVADNEIDPNLEEAVKAAEDHVRTPYDETVKNDVKTDTSSQKQEDTAKRGEELSKLNEINELTEEEKAIILQAKRSQDPQYLSNTKTDEALEKVDEKLKKKREKLLLKLKKIQEKGYPVDPTILDYFGESRPPQMGDPRVMMP